MNSQDLQNLQEAYTQVYSVDEERAPGVKPYTPNRRQPLPEPKPLSGETGDRSGYGADEKFKKPDDRIKKPGTEVPPVQTYGRISRFIPHGIGAHGNRVRSRNSTVIGLDPGAPRSEVIPPQEKKKPSREIVRKTKKEDFELWVNNLLDEGYDLSGYTWEGLYEEYIQNEAYDIYDVILSHLINEGYADTFESAEVIMVNMSEEWRESILSEDPVQDYRDMMRAKENAAGLRGPELSHSVKPAGSASGKVISDNPRGREFEKVKNPPSKPRSREFTNPPS